jgi:Class-II DAHP synthetase family
LCDHAIPCTTAPSPQHRAKKPSIRPDLKKVGAFFSVCAAESLHAGGAHLEMTGLQVTECTGGTRAITDEDFNDLTKGSATRVSLPSNRPTSLLATLLRTGRTGNEAAACGYGVVTPAWAELCSFAFLVPATALMAD